LPKLTITFDVPDGIYCGIIGQDGPKCRMCLRRPNGDYICVAYKVRLLSDVSGPLKTEDCERKTSNLPRMG